MNKNNSSLNKNNHYSKKSKVTIRVKKPDGNIPLESFRNASGPILPPAEYSAFVNAQSPQKNISAEFEINRIRHTLSSYVTMLGGYLDVPKGDSKYNSLNLLMINAVKSGYGTAYMGHMADLYNKDEMPVDEIFTEYSGQDLSPFCCDFVVPIKDSELEKLVNLWNKSAAPCGKTFRKILTKVNSLGGVFLSWA